MELTRREFVQLGGGLAAAAVMESCRRRFTHDLACQLYTLRSLLPESAEVVLRTVAEIGYREVEAYGTGLEILLPSFDRFSLRPVAVHFPSGFLTGEADPEEEIVRAKEAGFRYGVVPFLPPEMRGKLDVYRRFADRMNGWGEQCRSVDLMLCYHNHAFEFEPMERSSPVEVMMEGFEADLVGLELDVFWSSVAGVDAVVLLDRYAGRVPLLHLKDKASNTPHTYDENEIRADQFKEVGNGVLNIPDILRTAESTGVRHYIVEQDYCNGDPLESLRTSFHNLRNARL